MLATKNTQHALSTKAEFDYLYGWIKKQSHTQKISPKMVNPRNTAGNAEEEEKMCVYASLIFVVVQLYLLLLGLLQHVTCWFT